MTDPLGNLAYLQKLRIMKRKGELPSNGEGTRDAKSSPAQRKADKEDRETLVLWKRPLTTINYFSRELTLNIDSAARRTLEYRKTLLSVVLVILILVGIGKLEGPHQPLLQLLKKQTLWSLYWVGLGVLSSIGLGTGLHTFLLYLGPHIAAVTMAAYECGGLNFPEPPYPSTIVCPPEVDPFWKTTIWNIMRKVSLESIMWGAGTALGELPPYFMARAARLSGHDPDDEDELKEFEELQKKKQNPATMSLVDRGKLLVEELVHKVGFFGILVCASIPNPLFDLAGITCGHFLVPFWTFFGATLIGKAIIKMSIQSVFVIVAFSDVLIMKLMELLGLIPVFGAQLQVFVQKMVEVQRAKLHQDAEETNPQSGNPLASIFEVFVLAMVGYFVLSIINSLAQSYHKRISIKTSKQPDKKKRED
uniref:Vacuole membrane protein 1 n=2 Tax=Lygus hesperus TaxID=30085 RepID=A0A0A9YPG3_LYGHE